jgi:hypothetical protein
MPAQEIKVSELPESSSSSNIISSFLVPNLFPASFSPSFVTEFDAHSSVEAPAEAASTNRRKRSRSQASFSETELKSRTQNTFPSLVAVAEELGVEQSSTAPSVSISAACLQQGILEESDRPKRLKTHAIRSIEPSQALSQELSRVPTAGPMHALGLVESAFVEPGAQLVEAAPMKAVDDVTEAAFVDPATLIEANSIAAGSDDRKCDSCSHHFPLYCEVDTCIQLFYLRNMVSI